MPSRKSFALLAAGAAFLVSAAFAQEGAVTDQETARQLMHERHENFETIGESFKTIRDQLRSKDSDMEAIAKASETINSLSKEIPSWFPEGTGPETGIETEAKAEIWQDWSSFTAAADRLVEESGKFVALTATGDKAKIMGGVRGLGGACKNCHDSFRVDED
ncbi:c-type cytochrome [Gilvimarinus sp. F26214L]|uniref:c-type cytochrome n=1 Tax=Gilvimarinus sp. DZF01 TaxID=3461371 RepID=UPI0040463E50